MTDSEHNDRRLGVLDGLRALAILLVLARHNLRPYWVDLHKPFLPMGPVDIGAFLLNGWCGVDLFFVLSGFLITRQLLFADLQTNPIWPAARKFYRRRFFRIAPAYYFVLALAILGLTPPYPINGHIPAGSALYHMAFLEDYLPADIIPSFWSLAVEFKFYAIAPLLVLFLCRQKPRLRFGLTTLSVLGSIAVKWLMVSHLHKIPMDYMEYAVAIRKPFHLVLDGLLLGMTAALLWQDRRARDFIGKTRIANFLFWGGLALFAGLMLPRPPLDSGATFFDMTFLTPLLSLAFAAMLLGLLCGCTARKFFESRVLKGIAMISYSLYLIHLPLVFAAYYITQQFFANTSAVTQWLLSMIPFGFICALGATMLYVTIERPFINWSKGKPVWS